MKNGSKYKYIKILCFCKWVFLLLKKHVTVIRSPFLFCEKYSDPLKLKLFLHLLEKENEIQKVSGCLTNEKIIYKENKWICAKHLSRLQTANWSFWWMLWVKQHWILSLQTYVQGHVMNEGNLLQVKKTTAHIMKGNMQAPPEHHW